MKTSYSDSISLLFRDGPRALKQGEAPSIITQHNDTKICGPCCVAMALNCSVETAMTLMNTKGGGTRTKQIVGAMSDFYEVPSELVKVKNSFTDPAILKLTFKDRRSGHWVLLWNGFIYDPSWGVFAKENWLHSVCIHTSSRVTSFLPIHVEESKCTVSQKASYND